ncbi:MAG: hypothetical protein AB7S57_07830 [Acetobacteraceae bacterium]
MPAVLAAGVTLAGLILAGPALADWDHHRHGQRGPRVGVYIGPPAYVPPPVYARPRVVVPPPVYVPRPMYSPPPVYAPPPVYLPGPLPYAPVPYAPVPYTPGPLAAACYAGPVNCPLAAPLPFGSPCQCQAGYGVFPGQAG